MTSLFLFHCDITNNFLYHLLTAIHPNWTITLCNQSYLWFLHGPINSFVTCSNVDNMNPVSKTGSLATTTCYLVCASLYNLRVTKFSSVMWHLLPSFCHCTGASSWRELYRCSNVNTIHGSYAPFISCASPSVTIKTLWQTPSLPRTLERNTWKCKRKPIAVHWECMHIRHWNLCCCHPNLQHQTILFCIFSSEGGITAQTLRMHWQQTQLFFVSKANAVRH
jgi:hypothetical protein